MNRAADAIVCGAGIAGVASAWHLAARHGFGRVAIVDERPPLSLTSDKSTECYRNWWPGPGDAMVSLMNRSVDLLEELAESSGNRFHLNRRGYLFATADPDRVAAFEAAGREAESLGAGALRRHDGRGGGADYVPHRTDGYTGMPDGADLIVDGALIRRHFPWLCAGGRSRSCTRGVAVGSARSSSGCISSRKRAGTGRSSFPAAWTRC